MYAKLLTQIAKPCILAARLLTFTQSASYIAHNFYQFRQIAIINSISYHNSIIDTKPQHINKIPNKKTKTETEITIIKVKQKTEEKSQSFLNLKEVVNLSTI